MGDDMGDVIAPKRRIRPGTRNEDMCVRFLTPKHHVADVADWARTGMTGRQPIYPSAWALSPLSRCGVFFEFGIFHANLPVLDSVSG